MLCLPTYRRFSASLVSELSPNSRFLVVGRIRCTNGAEYLAQGKARQFGQAHAGHRTGMT